MESRTILAASELHSSFLMHTGVVPARADENLLSPSNEQAFQHLSWMMNECGVFIRDERREKAMRWVCFAQGVLWDRGLANIRFLKDVMRDKSLPYDSRA